MCLLILLNLGDPEVIEIQGHTIFKIHYYACTDTKVYFSVFTMCMYRNMVVTAPRLILMPTIRTRISIH